MNVLYSYHTDPLYMAPRRFSENQVNCGPFFEDREEGGRIVSLKTPPGEYDLPDIVARLPAAQRPDLVVVKADASRLNLPRDVHRVGCVSVLIVGDTQHMVRPLAGMLEYAEVETFDFVMTDHGRRVLHHFAAAGCANTFWIPGINLRTYSIEGTRPDTYPLSFVGGYGAAHPVRFRALRSLLEHGQPMHVRSTGQEAAARIYPASQINLNVSLNGDVNLRVFEVVAHGGLLLTDALRPQAGLGDLFRIGEEVLTFDGFDDLNAQVSAYMNDPAACAAIAARGHERYLRDHTPEVRLAQFFDILNRRPVPDYLHGPHDRRVAAARGRPRRAFDVEIGVYEVLQALNRNAPEAGLVAFPGVSVDLVASAADLSRVAVCAVAASADERARLAVAFAERGVETQVRIVGWDEVEALDHLAVLTDRAGFEDPRFQACLGRGTFFAHVADGEADDEVAARMAFLGYEAFAFAPGMFVSGPARPFLDQLRGG